MNTPFAPGKLASLTLAALLCASTADVSAGGRNGEAATKGHAANKLYIVQMREQPVVAYEGDIGTLSFSGLAPMTRYLGSVVYGGATGMPNPTIVRVDTP